MTKQNLKRRGTKTAFLTSLLSLILCVTMLIGTTLAWFTDTVTSGDNQIIAGNLDLDVQYTTNEGQTWTSIQGVDSLFDKNALWEPGHTEVVYLKVTNLGTLAFNYKLNVTPVSESGGINMAGKQFLLSDYLVFKTVANSEYMSYTRDTARDAAGSEQKLTQDSLAQAGTLEAGKSTYVTMVVYMPETVNNDANYKTGTTAPKITLGITAYAWQKDYEKDSFGSDYDANADLTPDNKGADAVEYNSYNQIVQAVQKDDDGQLTEQTLTEYAADNETLYAQVKVPATRVAEDADNMSMVLEETTAPANLTVASTQGSKNYELTVTGLVEGTDVITGTMFIGKGLENVKLYHNVTEEFSSEGITSEAQVTAHGKYYYNSDSGYITFATTSFSPFSALFDMPAGVSGEGTMEETYYKTADAAQAAANEGTEVYAYRDVVATEDNNTEDIEKEEGEQFDIPQAKIGNTYYATLAEAIEAAESNDTITLIKDCETGDYYGIPAEAPAEKQSSAKPLVLRAANVTLDLNGKTITVTHNFSFVIAGDNDIVMNGTIQSGEKRGTNSEYYRGYPLVVAALTSGEKVTGVQVNNVTINGGISAGGSTDNSITDIKGAGIVTLKDCTIQSGFAWALYSQTSSTLNVVSGTYSAGSSGLACAESGSTISISGGTFDVNPKDYVDEAYAVNQIGEQYEVGEDTVNVAINTTTKIKYGSLSGAIGAATDGQTVKLLLDCDLSETLTVDKNLTLDMNKKTVTVSSTGYAFDVKTTAEGKTFTVNNGTFIGSNNPAGVAQIASGSATANLVFTGVNIHGATANDAFTTNNGVIADNTDDRADSITLTNVNINTAGDIVTGSNSRAYASLTVTGGTFVSSYRGFRFCGAADSTSVIDGANITTSNGIAVYAFSNTTLKNSTINMTATGNNDAVAASAAHNTGATLTVENTTITANGTALSAIAAESLGNVVINSGTFKNNNNSAYVAKVSNSSGSITINGGTFGTAEQNAQQVLFTNTKAKSEPDPDARILVNDGTFYGKAGVSSDNAFVEIKGGTFKNDFTLIESNGQHVRLLSGCTATFEGAVTGSGKVTIPGGTFKGTVTLTGTNSSITGGTFEKQVTLVNAGISGGTFWEDPTKYVSSGYVASKNGNVWTVEEGVK